MHVVLYPYLHGQFDETLEEVWVVAYDQYIMKYINQVKARRDRWNDLIMKKLKESEDRDLTPVPYEEQVLREGKK